MKKILVALTIAYCLIPIASFAATGCTYPTTLDILADVTQSQDLTAVMYNKLQCMIEKAQAELGTLPKGGYADVKTRLDDAVYTSGAQTVTGAKSFSDVITSALGIITTDKQNLSATATWNAAAVNFTALKLNVTNTASAAASLLIDIQVNNISKFKVDKTGLITATLSGNASTATALAANPADCAVNTFATTIAANGDLTCATPNLGTADVTGTLTVAKGGTGQTTATGAFNALSPSTTLGDIIYHDGAGGARLAGNITTTRKFLRETGTGVVSAAPAWDTLIAGDLPTHTHAASDINSGVLALARGALNTDLSAGGATGDLLYANAATTFARLAGNATATKKFLTMTSSVPAWSLIDTFALFDNALCTDGQIVKKVTGAWACATDATAGTPALDTVADPAANKAFSMSAATLAFNWTSATPAAASVFSVTDPINNPGTGDLFDVHTASGSILKPLRVTAAGTVNGIEMSTTGALAAIGSGTITANRTGCTGSDYLKADGTCGVLNALLWSGIGNPTANLSLSMGAFTTTLTYNDATSTVNLFKLIDGLNNPGTGYLATFETAAGSTLKPLRVSYRGADTLIVSGGNIGIGTANPQSNLHLSSSFARFVLSDTDEVGGTYNWEIGNARDVAGQLNITTFDQGGFINPSTKVSISKTGNVGIGTTSPTALLTLGGTPLINTDTSVGFDNKILSLAGGGNTANNRGASLILQGAVAGGSAIIEAGNTLATSQIELRTGNVVSLVAKNNGNIGIGTTSPNVGLELGATLDMRLPKIKSITGQRYVCVDTNGTFVSSVSACSGT